MVIALPEGAADIVLISPPTPGLIAVAAVDGVVVASPMDEETFSAEGVVGKWLVMAGADVGTWDKTCDDDDEDDDDDATWFTMGCFFCAIISCIVWSCSIPKQTARQRPASQAGSWRPLWPPGRL